MAREREIEEVVLRRQRFTPIQTALNMLISDTLDPDVREREVNELTSVMADGLGFEESMLAALPTALLKDPAVRGRFDNMVIAQLYQEIEMLTAKLDASTEQAKPEKEKGELELQKAQEAHDKVKREQHECATKFIAAQATLKEAEIAAKEAKNEVDSFKSECEQNIDAVLLAKDRVVEFQEGPLATFIELRELSSVPPVVENTSAEHLEDASVPQESGEPVDTHMLPLVDGFVEGVAASCDNAPDAEDTHVAMDLPVAEDAPGSEGPSGTDTGADDGPDANGPPCARGASTEAPSSNCGPVAPDTSSASEWYDEISNLKNAPIKKDDVGVNSIPGLSTDNVPGASDALDNNNALGANNANGGNETFGVDSASTDGAANAGVANADGTGADNVADVDNAANAHDAVAAHISDCGASEAASLGTC